MIMNVDPVEISEKVKLILEPVIEGMGYRVFDVEFKSERGWVLRVIIDREGGISIKDCEEVSRRVSPILDVEDLIPFSYNLEVSSPGLTRELEKPSHYEFFRGRLARVILREPLQGKREILGYIGDVDESIISFREKEGGETLHIPFSIIARGRLEPEKW